jgi:Fe-S oxidoreductase
MSSDDGFSYAALFGDMRTLGEVLRDAPERPWLTSVPRPAPAHRHVVWLGCNILRTAHIAETLDDILRHVGTDFVMLGGPSNCCGIVHRQHGDTAVGDNMLRQTMGKFDAFAPDQLLWWCPSCDNELRLAEATTTTETAKARRSVTTFLADQGDRLRFNRPVPARVAIHAHAGTPEQDADLAAATRLLGMVPGLEIVETAPLRDFGRHCTDGDAFKHGKAAYAQSVGDWIAAARVRGATEIVSIYHSCHRQLLLAQKDFPADARMGVTNYLTLLARGLGLAERSDRFAQFAAAPSPDALLDELEPADAPRGVDRARARKALKAQFG